MINKSCQLIDRDAVRNELRLLKSLHVDGVFVDCWWGIVEPHNPQKYIWSGYRELFNIIHEFELKLQVSRFNSITLFILIQIYDHVKKLFLLQI